MNSATKLITPALALSMGMLATTAIAGEAAKKTAMNTYVIERDLKDVEKADFKAVATKSNAALSQLKGEVVWKHSYVVDDKTYCIYEAPNEEAVKQHAKISGFPADKITKLEFQAGPMNDPAHKAKKVDTSKMKTFIIERNLPGAEKLDWKGVAVKSNGVIANELKSGVVWDHSYVVKDKIYCVYQAPSDDLVKQHAKIAGFPADKVTAVAGMIDPSSEKK